MSRIESNDVVLRKNKDGIYDISFDQEGDIETNDFLDTFLMRAIYAERRALSNEMPVPNQRRGWIGNVGRDYEDGSKVWLFEQAPLTRSTINGIKSELISSLSPLTDLNIALDYSVDTTVNNLSEITAEITVQRDYSQVESRYYKLFENSGVTE